MATLLMKAGPSKGGRNLARTMGIHTLRPTGRVLRNASIINWGCGNSAFEEFSNRFDITSTIYNRPDCVSRASNKLTCLERLSGGGLGDDVVPFTTDPEVARGWVHGGGSVVSRYTLHGHSGEGIEIDTDYDRFIHKNRPPLYTKYIKKKKEFRVHVVGEAVDVQQKKKRQETPNDEVNYQVRNHSNGWIYARQIGEIDNRLIDLARAAIEMLELDFGAVDIIWNQKQDKYYILEVNTAPGLEGQSLEFYANNLRGLL